MAAKIEDGQTSNLKPKKQGTSDKKKKIKHLFVRTNIDFIDYQNI